MLEEDASMQWIIMGYHWVSNFARKEYSREVYLDRSESSLMAPPVKTSLAFDQGLPPL